MSASKVRLYRLSRGEDAAHVGDFLTRTAAYVAAKDHEPAWIEPIDWNGDVNFPVYKSAGKREAVAA